MWQYIHYRITYIYYWKKIHFILQNFKFFYFYLRYLKIVDIYPISFWYQCCLSISHFCLFLRKMNQVGRTWIFKRKFSQNTPKISPRAITTTCCWIGPCHGASNHFFRAKKSKEFEPGKVRLGMHKILHRHARTKCRWWNQDVAFGDWTEVAFKDLIITLKDRKKQTCA